jgi:8-oxo-dGTP pyrophosphatase MutT (NUDIX family)
MSSQALCTPLPHRSESGVRAFAASLLSQQRDALQLLRARARQEVPGHCLGFRCGSQVLGHLLPAHGAQLAAVLKNAVMEPHTLVWNAQDANAAERSTELQAALLKLRGQGLLGGWRNEDFCFFPNQHARPDPTEPAFIRIERAGFRYLGMMSHAVHINAFTSDGRMWCGKRSDSKATDPGLWDNMTAGGLGAGESLESCAVRELWEEAGLSHVEPAQLRSAGHVRISRITPSGWHDEMLHVYNLQVPDPFVPHNQDGEVQAFACLSGAQVLAGIAAGQWTPDAALALAQGLLSQPDICT